MRNAFFANAEGVFFIFNKILAPRLQGRPMKGSFQMNRKWIALFACVILCISVFAGCAQSEPAASVSAEAAQEASVSPSELAAQPSGSAPAAGVSVTDMAGAEVTVEKADRIVSLTPAGTEIVCALGAAKQLVGIDAYSNYPEITQSIEIVGDFNGPDVEKVTALEPDVVLAGTGLQQDAVDKLGEMGITVVVVEATAFDDIPKSIELVGKIVGMEDVAEQVTADIDAAVKSAQDNQPSEEKTVYYAMSYGDMGNWTSGPGSFINTMIELAGGKCITADQAAPWIEYSLEDLAAADPDIILLDSSMGSTEALAEVAGYKDLTAVRNGNVYAIDADVFTRPGPRIGEAVLEISEILNK